MKFGICCLLLAGSSASVFAAAPTVEVIDEIVAKVNGDIVTRGELDRSRREMEAEGRKQNMPAARLAQELEALQKDVLRDKIDQLLLQQQGKELNINVGSEISKRVAEIQTQVKIADPEKFRDMVRQQTGMPYEDYISDMKNGMLTQRVIRQEVGGRISIKHDEVQKYYDAHKAEFMRKDRVFLREILLSTEGKDAASVAALEKKAKDLTARARKGERFPELARDNSDAVTAQQGGALEGLEKGKLAQNIENLVWSQPRGYVTDPIHLDNGFLILKVDEHQKEGQAELTEVEPEINERLYAPRMQGAVREYLTKLRTTAFLQIKKDFIDSGAAPGMDTSWVDPATLKPETVKKGDVVKTRRKHFLGAPIPGTKTSVSSSGKTK